MLVMGFAWRELRVGQGDFLSGIKTTAGVSLPRRRRSSLLDEGALSIYVN